MAQIHIPNETPEATQEAIENSQPGDELIFDASEGLEHGYTLNSPLHITPDRKWWIVNQYIAASDTFQGRYLIEAEDGVEYYCIVGCIIEAGEHGGILVKGPHATGVIQGNIITHDDVHQYPPLSLA